MTTSLQIITLLRARGPMTVQQIAIVVSRSPSTVQSAIAGLSKRSIVAVAGKERGQPTDRKPRNLWDIKA